MTSLQLQVQRCCRACLGQQTRLLPRLHVPVLFLPAVGDCRVCSSKRHLSCSPHCDLPSCPGCSWYEAGHTVSTHRVHTRVTLNSRCSALVPPWNLVWYESRLELCSIKGLQAAGSGGLLSVGWVGGGATWGRAQSTATDACPNLPHNGGSSYRCRAELGLCPCLEHSSCRWEGAVEG